jgi:hypothetical protein
MSYARIITEGTVTYRFNQAYITFQQTEQNKVTVCHYYTHTCCITFSLFLIHVVMVAVITTLMLIHLAIRESYGDHFLADWQMRTCPIALYNTTPFIFLVTLKDLFCG